MINVLLDGDWILYAAGFAGQKNELVCPTLFGGETFPTITAIRTRHGQTFDTEEFPVYTRHILDDESHFYHSAKMMITRGCARIAGKFDEGVTPVMLIAGDGNFRSQLATIKPYKGNRSVHAKPLMYNNIRQYLLDNHAASVTHGQETDDAMAIAQTRFQQAGVKSIILSIDKDMLQIPGWHFNPNKGFMFVSPQEGLERLYTQCIQGDPTDNIGGAYKFGPVAARKCIVRGMNEQDMWEATLCAYDESIEKHGDHIYNGLSAGEAALENMRLVYLRRHTNELWKPPEDRV